MENNKLVVYLAGPMEDVEDGGVQWRERISKSLLNYFGNGIVILDPCQMEVEKLKGFIDEKITSKKIKEVLQSWRLSGHWEKFDPAMAKVIEFDFDCLRRSDFIILFLKFEDKQKNKIQMGGTISELTYAYQHRIPIYAVTYNVISKCNSWIIRMARGNIKPIEERKIFSNFNQVLEALSADYKLFKKEE